MLHTEGRWVRPAAFSLNRRGAAPPSHLQLMGRPPLQPEPSRPFQNPCFARRIIVSSSRFEIPCKEPPVDICPCGSSKPYADCCRPVITCERRADTAEQLMRSRY